jgi:thiamine biosynthesis lipoprotein
MNNRAVRVYIRPRMGTLLGLTIQAPPGTAERLAERAFRRTATLERLMTRFDPESPLAQINRAAGRPVMVPAELVRVLRVEKDLARLTGGAFDPTLAPLLDLWRQAASDGRAPSREIVTLTRQRVGWRGLGVRGRRAGLARDGMALDLGAIGKGWAADRMAKGFAGTEGLSALINFGESTAVATGRAPKAGGWPILLRHPLGGFAGRFFLANRACSTSGSLGQAYRLGRRILGHVLDPRSGRPLTTPTQVTVLACSATVAEAASTALLVLGRSAIRWIARALRVDVCWIDSSGTFTTARFGLRPLGQAAKP